VPRIESGHGDPDLADWAVAAVPHHGSNLCGEPSDRQVCARMVDDDDFLALGKAGMHPTARVLGASTTVSDKWDVFLARERGPCYHSACTEGR